MALSKLGLKVLGLCVALAGLMAIGAGSAQAEAGSFWLVNGVKISEKLLPEITGSLENNHGVLLGIIGSNKLHILCTGGTLVGSSGTAVGAHLVEPNGAALGRVRFTGCKILELKEGVAKELAACEPHEGTEKGVVLTTNGKALISLPLALEPAVLIEPATGTLFATVNTSEECAFGEKIKVEGKLVIKDCEGKFLTDLVSHLIEEYPEMKNAEGKNVGTELYLNGNKANKATLDGSALVSLSGVAHKGLTFAGHAN